MIIRFEKKGIQISSQEAILSLANIEKILQSNLIPKHDPVKFDVKRKNILSTISNTENIEEVETVSSIINMVCGT